MNINKFEYVKKSKKDFNLPKRGTKHSAGYDFYSPKSFVLNPNETIFISLEVKCKINSDEFLMILPRSSMGFKGTNHITMTNTVGIIDSDYYNNHDNEGCIGLKLHNNGPEPFIVNKNDRLVQGIFLKYDLTSDDSSDTIRVGGYGSTGR